MLLTVKPSYESPMRKQRFPGRAGPGEEPVGTAADLKVGVDRAVFGDAEIRGA